MALALLGLIVGVLVRVHLQPLRAAEFSRLRGEALLEAETIVTGSMLGHEADKIASEARDAGWRVTNESAGAPGGLAFTEWRVAVSNPQAPSVVLLLRVAEGTGAVAQANHRDSGMEKR